MKEILFSICLFSFAFCKSQCSNYASYQLNGNGFDSGMNNLDGSNIGATATIDRFGNTNSAMAFDGNDYIELPSDFDFSTRTINVWFKAESSTSQPSVIYDSDHPSMVNASTKMYVWINASQTTVLMSVGNGGLAAHNEPINLNQWYMGTIVVGSDLKYYLNAQLVATFPLNPGVAASGNSTAVIGASRLLDRFFDGIIDDVSIYTCELNQQSIDSLFVLGAIPGCMIADYNFSGDASDVSSNSFDGTNNGATLTNDRYNDLNSAYNFDGSNDYIDLPSDFDFPQRTINVWFRAETSSTTQSVIYDCDHPGLSNGSTKMYIWEYNSETSLIMSVGNSGLAFHNEPINLNQWYMATMVVGTDVKFYLNAQQVATFALNLGSAASGHSTSLIGADRLITRFFDGDIDDVSIYNCALDLNVIDSLFSNFTFLNEITFNELKLFPNPAIDKLMIGFPKHFNSISYTILDLTGKQIINSNLNGNIIDLQGLGTGIYFLKMNLDGVFYRQKFIKN